MHHSNSCLTHSMSSSQLVAKHTETLPLELIREILLRLPVKFVLQCKCVCKAWLSLISNSQFGISHYDLATAPPSHRLILRSNDFYVQSIDTDAPFIDRGDGTVCLLRAVHLLLPPPSPPRIPDFFHYNEFRNQPLILGSCRGFILLYYQKGDDLILWNPSTGARRQLPYFQYDRITGNFLYGFGYDPSTDDYLIIIIPSLTCPFAPKNRIYIFSFKTSSWNRVDVNVPYSDPGSSTLRGGLLFNGALHWLVYSYDKRVLLILAFDPIRRSLSEIPVFDHFTPENYNNGCSLSDMGGCLNLCYSVQGRARTEIWVMKEYKVQSSWTKSIVIPTCDFSPICITKDGGIFGSDMRSLEKYNDKGELLEHRMYGVEEELFYCVNLPSARYRESLLSLPTLVRNTTEDDHQQLIRKIRAMKLASMYS